MTKHYLLIEEADWAGPTPRLVKGPDIDLTRGRMEAIEEPFEFILEVDKQADDPIKFPPADFCTTVNHPLFSSRFQETLKKVGVDNIQYFPTRAIYEPNGQVVDYQVANVTGVVQALDIEASECEMDDEGFVEDIETIVLNEDALHNFDFVRFYDLLDIIIISERVADAIKSANLTGLRIIEPSDWEPGLF